MQPYPIPVIRPCNTPALQCSSGIFQVLEIEITAVAVGMRGAEGLDCLHGSIIGIKIFFPEGNGQGLAVMKTENRFIPGFSFFNFSGLDAPGEFQNSLAEKFGKS